MKLIAVISHKGGAGKTTSAVQIAEELARRGQRTLLVDADRQQGAGLLLGIDAPAGCVQRTTVPELDYLGSARLTVSSPREGITELRPRSALASTIATSTLKQRPLLGVTVS